MSDYDVVVWKHGNTLTKAKHFVDPNNANKTLCGWEFDAKKVSTSHWAQKKPQCEYCEAGQLHPGKGGEVMGEDAVKVQAKEDKPVEPLFDGNAVTLASLKQGVYLDLDVLPDEFDTDMDGEHVIVTGLRHFKGDKTTVMITFEKTGPLATANQEAVKAAPEESGAQA